MSRLNERMNVLDHSPRVSDETARPDSVLWTEDLYEDDEFFVKEST